MKNPSCDVSAINDDGDKKGAAVQDDGRIPRLPILGNTPESVVPPIETENGVRGARNVSIDSTSFGNP